MSLNSIWRSLGLTIFVCVAFLDTSCASGPHRTGPEIVQQEKGALEQNGYHPWEWMKSEDCSNCEVFYLPEQPQVRTEKVELFMHALSAHKTDLMALYHVSSNEYNLLGHMAIGILGRESEFFTSTRYQVKEAFPSLVHLTKIIHAYLEGHKEASVNSRGPTQIKVVPALIEQNYGITTDNLYVPENAAVATMGYLIEALAQLKKRVIVDHLDFIEPENYEDYLPYIYFGQSKALVNRTATPDTNLYVQTMKKYMSWVDVYERATPLRAN